MKWVCIKCGYILKLENREIANVMLNGCPKCGCFRMKVEGDKHG